MPHVQLNKEYASNGDCCVQLNREETNPQFLICSYVHTITSEDYNKQITFTADLTNKLNGSAVLQIKAEEIVQTNISRDSKGTFSVSTTIPENLNTLQCIVAFSGTITGCLFADNIKLTIQ